MHMSKGKATSFGSFALNKLKSVITPGKEAVPSTPEVPLPSLNALCQPTEAKLWGYDIGKKMLSDTVDKSDTVRISEAVSIMIKAEGETMVPTCKAFLIKLGFGRDRLKNPTREMFFSGGNQQGIAGTPVTPQEMKYAVLVLLGLSESMARNQLKFYDKDSPSRLALSPGFEGFVTQVKEKRALYPLQHPEEFTDVRNALEKVRPYLGNTDIKRMFNDGGIPQHVMQTTGEKSVSPLVDALSSLATALEHGISIGHLYLDSKDYPLPSFSSYIIAMVEAKRKEKQTPKSPANEKLG